jgi:hypothetical protein
VGGEGVNWKKLLGELSPFENCEEDKESVKE